MREDALKVGRNAEKLLYNKGFALVQLHSDCTKIALQMHEDCTKEDTFQ